MPDWSSFVVLPLTGAAIGWATNWVALKMLFHPRRRTCGMQGLLPRRQADLARDVGRIIAAELVDRDRLLAGIEGIDLTPRLAPVLDAALAAKAQEYQKIPLIGMLITEDRIKGIRDGLVAEFAKAQPALLRALKDELGKRIDIAQLAQEKLAALDLDRLERMVRDVASREFRAIEWWGAILGGLIGLAQAGLLLAL